LLIGHFALFFAASFLHFFSALLLRDFFSHFFVYLVLNFLHFFSSLVEHFRGFDGDVVVLVLVDVAAVVVVVLVVVDAPE
jgi:hypothetical protein